MRMHRPYDVSSRMGYERGNAREFGNQPSRLGEGDSEFQPLQAADGLLQRNPWLGRVVVADIGEHAVQQLAELRPRKTHSGME